MHPEAAIIQAVLRRLLHVLLLAGLGHPARRLVHERLGRVFHRRLEVERGWTTRVCLVRNITLILNGLRPIHPLFRLHMLHKLIHRCSGIVRVAASLDLVPRLDQPSDIAS